MYSCPPHPYLHRIVCRNPMDTETPGCSSSIKKKKGMTAFQIIGSHIPMDIQSQLQMKTVRTRERYREEIGLKKK